MAVERQQSNLPPAQPSYILRGHAAQIHSVQFVRQNTRLVTGDADGWVIFWKLETKRALAVWKAHDGAILGTAEWGRDKIVTHGRDNSLRIWQMRASDEPSLSTSLPAEAASGDRPMPWLLHTLPVNTLNFCAFSMCYAPVQEEAYDHQGIDGGAQLRSQKTQSSILVAVPARDDKRAEVYQFPEERLKYMVPRAQSKDTGMVMAIKLMCDPSTRQLMVATGYEGGLTAVHFLPQDDGSSIGVAQLVYLSQPHTQPILSLDITPDAKTYFTSGADAVVAAHRIPDLTSQRKPTNVSKRRSADSDDPPISIPTSNSGSTPQTIAHSTLDSGSEMTQAEDPPISIPDESAPLSFGKRYVPPPASKSGGLSSLLSTELSESKTAQGSRPPPSPPTTTAQAPHKINNTKHSGQQSLSVRSDGRLLVTGGWDSRIRIYSTKTLKEVAVLKWHKEGVYAVAFGQILEVGILESLTERDDVQDGSEVVKRETGLGKLQRQREEKMQVKHWVAAGAKDGKISLWEVF